MEAAVMGAALGMGVASRAASDFRLHPLPSTRSTPTIPGSCLVKELGLVDGEAAPQAAVCRLTVLTEVFQLEPHIPVLGTLPYPQYLWQLALSSPQGLQVVWETGCRRGGPTSSRTPVDVGLLHPLACLPGQGGVAPGV